MERGFYRTGWEGDKAIFPRPSGAGVSPATSPVRVSRAVASTSETNVRLVAAGTAAPLQYVC